MIGRTGTGQVTSEPEIDLVEQSNVVIHIGEGMEANSPVIASTVVGMVYSSDACFRNEHATNWGSVCLRSIAFEA